MNPRYLETFSRHPVLFCVPIVLAMLVATWFNLGTPKSYGSNTSLWIDDAVAGGSALAQPEGSIRPPAEQQHLLLSELLSTRRFRIAVARKSGLADYLADHKSEGWGPTALLSRLRGTATLNDRVVAMFTQKRVGSTIVGPHVLAIRLEAPTPSLAARTLGALVAELNRRSSALRQETLRYYENRVTAASKDFTTARAALESYLRRVPGATSSDASFRALSQARDDALQRVTDATEQYQQAAISLGPASEKRAFRVIDPPVVPTGPTSGRKKMLLALFAGLFGGAVVSALGIVALTTASSSRRSGGRVSQDQAVREPPGEREPDHVLEQPALQGKRLAEQHGSGDQLAAASAEADSLREEGAMAEEAIRRHDGFRGTIVDVRDDRVGRRTRRVWTIHQPPNGQLRPNAGSHVSINGTSGVIRDVKDADAGGFLVEVELEQEADSALTRKRR